MGKVELWYSLLSIPTILYYNIEDKGGEAMIRNPFREIDAKKLRRSSDILKKQNDYQKIVNHRLQVVGLVTILIFVVIAGKLVDIQVRQKDSYAVKLESYTSKKQVSSTPRGQMYDRDGKLVAATTSSINITYFAPENTSASEQWDMAVKFAKQFNVSSEDLTSRDLQDAYIALHTDENGKNDYANHLLSAEELKLSDTEIYNLKLSKITQEMLDAELDSETRSAWVVYNAMEVHSQNSHARVILEDVSEDQIAYLTEHKSDYTGFDVDFSSWEREYPYGSTFRDILGQVTTSKQGLPSELQQYYQAKGYEMNAQVGKSGLEQQYQDLLAGTAKVSTIKYDEDGTPILSEVNAGKKGYDLQLTIDIELQEKIDGLLKSTLEKYTDSATRPDMDKLFVSLMNPNTGEIYASSGMLRNEDGSIINYASGNYLDGYTPGSIVKGATVYMGLSEGVVTPTELIMDEPLLIQGTPQIASYQNWGQVNAVRALSVSSNVYMAQIAMRLAGTSYIKNGPLLVEDPTATFNLMRSYYSMFGLGVLTGLDVPNEQLGYSGFSKSPGQLLYFSFGQYDNYTPIQILQYAATVANGGKKVKPRYVSGAYGVNSESLVYTNDAEVVSTIGGDLDSLKVVQDGFRTCVTDGNCGGKIKSLPYSVAAKTGTAEVVVDGHDSTNASLIGYFPSDKPEVAFVCAAPTSSNVNPNAAVRVQENVCYNEIMPEVIQYYYSTK